MSNPYRGLPAHQFWRSLATAAAPTDVDPVIAPGFVLDPSDRIATAGSCFAQHIARKLATSGYGYMVTESAPAFAFSEDENYGTFSARFGNIYTVRQLLQLFRRAYSTYEPVEAAWCRADGRIIDPFRPQIQAGGFATAEEMLQDRGAHLAAVREMFEDCDVFIFTLGLTEAWVSKTDGAVFPVAPGTVAAGIAPADYAFHNFTVAEMEADLVRFVDYLRGVNPGVRIILTVSPVPLIATYEPRHVLVSNTYSKAALRVLAEQIVKRFSAVDYFPSYEMITGPHSAGRFYAADLRSVQPEGVSYVMSHFGHHYLKTNDAIRRQPIPETRISDAMRAEQEAAMDTVAAVICDEEIIERSL